MLPASNYKKIPIIKINDALPDGLLAGYTPSGRMVCCIEFYPNYNFLFGDADSQGDVWEWCVCSAHAHRIAMISHWHDSDYLCLGES